MTLLYESVTNLPNLWSRLEVATVTRTAQEEVLRRDTEQAATLKVSDGNLSYSGNCYFFLNLFIYFFFFGGGEGSKNVQRNSAEAHFRIPFSQHPKSNGFDVSYGLITSSLKVCLFSRRAAILICREYRSLFKPGLHRYLIFTPLHLGGASDVSIVNEVLRGLVLLSRDQAVAKISRLDLLKYLLPMFHHNPQTLNYDDFN